MRRSNDHRPASPSSNGRRVDGLRRHRSCRCPGGGSPTVSRIAVTVTLCLLSPRPVSGQNVVDPGLVGPVHPPIHITTDQVRQVIDYARPSTAALPDAAKSAVTDLLDRHPWRPLHLTLGISGFESYFTHPDETFFVLSLLPPSSGLRVLLVKELETHPPYAAPGYRLDDGIPRELYDVPAELLPKGRAQAEDCFGVYSFWLFCRTFGFGNADAERAAMQQHWKAVKIRIQPLLTSEYRFDPAKLDYSHDEAEHLNGDIAGLIGVVRLGKTVDDTLIEAAAHDRLRELLELRVNLDRINPRVWAPTHFSSKTLHTGKLARYLKLTPELGFALRMWTDGAAAARLQAVRKNFPTWWIARGDRLIGGENYISPLHFSRALWQGLAWIEADERRWDGVLLDIPWCRADLAFIEKAVIKPEN
jgi:hypothetical protein